MTEVYKYLNGNSPDIMNDIFKLKENICNLRNFHIFLKENLGSVKYGLDAMQLWQQVPVNV